MRVCNQTATDGRNISTWERSEVIFASSAPCAGVISNREKLPIWRQSFLSATIAEGKVGLNQSDHLVEASNGMHVYELGPRKDHRGAIEFPMCCPSVACWYGEPNAVSNAVDYAKFRSRSHCAVIRVYDAAGLGLFTQSNDKLI
jgi:hypothetical protein